MSVGKTDQLWAARRLGVTKFTVCDALLCKCALPDTLDCLNVFVQFCQCILCKGVRQDPVVLERPESRSESEERRAREIAVLKDA